MTTEDVVTSSSSRPSSGVVGSAVVSQVVARPQEPAGARGLRRRAGSLAFDQEEPEQLWVGGREANQHPAARPEHRSARRRARYSPLPAGHAQGYQDCFDTLRRRHRTPPSPATTVDGLPDLRRRPARGPAGRGRSWPRPASAAWVEVAGRDAARRPRRWPRRRRRRPSEAAARADRPCGASASRSSACQVLHDVDLDLRAGRGARPRRRERRRQVDADEDPGRGPPGRRRHASSSTGARSPSSTRWQAQRAGVVHRLPGVQPAARADAWPRTSSSAASRARLGVVDARPHGRRHRRRCSTTSGVTGLSPGTRVGSLSVAEPAGGRDRQGASRPTPGSSRWTSRPPRWPTTRSSCSTGWSAG